jgi:hypothetical protein
LTELPVQALLLEAIEILDRLHVDSMIMGGFAVRSWGVPRPTYDADLAVAAEGEALARVWRRSGPRASRSRRITRRASSIGSAGWTR